MCESALKKPRYKSHHGQVSAKVKMKSLRPQLKSDPSRLLIAGKQFLNNLRTIQNFQEQFPKIARDQERKKDSQSILISFPSVQIDRIKL